MDQVSFSLPTLASAAMPMQDQINVSVNQAAAIVVTAYLEHLDNLSRVIPPGSQNSANQSVASQAELVSLINDVQTALKSV